MQIQSTITGAGAALLASGALLAAPVAQAADGATVTVRVEGRAHTLVATRQVAIPSGTESFQGHPYPGDTVLGVLEAATHGQVDGTYSTYGAFVTTIDGEVEPGTKANPFYFETFVNGVAAQLGDDSQTVKPGDVVLIGAVDQNAKPDLPIVVTAPAATAAGHAATVRVAYVDAKGVKRPLAGATVKLGTVLRRSGATGRLTFTPTRAGRLTVTVTKPGYVRDEATVRVRGAR